MAREMVGVIGLGLMGEVLAGRLMAAGFCVKGYDIDPAKKPTVDQVMDQKIAADGVAAAGGRVTIGNCKL